MRGFTRKTAFMAVLVLTIFLISCSNENNEITLPTDESVGESEEQSTQETTAVKPISGNDSQSEEKSVSSDSKEKIIYPDRSYADESDDKLALSSADNFFRSRTTDEKSGDIVDMSVYFGDERIIKIVTEDYGSEGRLESEYYYKGDDVAYIRQKKTDVFGTVSLPSDVDLEDTESDYVSEVIDDAQKAIKEAGKQKAMTLLYGYVGDEQGGVLKNVQVKLRNVAGDYNDETMTDGDGYYSFMVPQEDDTYNLSYFYDNCAVSTLNDVHIIQGIPEYSLGREYVAPEGQGVHDTDVYLMNVKAKSPVKLKDNEYAAVLTSDSNIMTMVLVNTDDQDLEKGTQVKFDPSKTENGYALFVEDSEYISKEDMAGTIGRTYMTVTIYNNKGIVAAYREPSGRLGTLWKVCTVNHDGEISISGLMYTDSKGWIGL